MKKVLSELRLLIPLVIIYVLIFFLGTIAEKKLRFEALNIPTFLVTQPEIMNGDIVTTSAIGQTKVIIDRSSLDQKGTSIINRIEVSPDRQNFCFETQAGKIYQVYWSDWAGENVVLLGEGTDCRWSPNSTKIAYLSPIGQDFTSTDVNCYWTGTGLKLNLTSRKSEPKRRYKRPIWSSNNVDLFVQYEEVSPESGTRSGIVEINTSSRTIIEK